MFYDFLLPKVIFSPSFFFFSFFLLPFPSLSPNPLIISSPPTGGKEIRNNLQARECFNHLRPQVVTQVAPTKIKWASLQIFTFRSRSQSSTPQVPTSLKKNATDQNKSLLRAIFPGLSVLPFLPLEASSSLRQNQKLEAGPRLTRRLFPHSFADWIWSKPKRYTFSSFHEAPISSSHCDIWTSNAHMRIQDAQRVTQRQEHSDNIQSITAALTSENNTVKLIHGLINTPLAFDKSVLDKIWTQSFSPRHRRTSSTRKRAREMISYWSRAWFEKYDLQNFWERK